MLDTLNTSSTGLCSKHFPCVTSYLLLAPGGVLSCQVSCLLDGAKAYSCWAISRGQDTGEQSGFSSHLLGFPLGRQHGQHRVQENLGREDVNYILSLMLWPQAWSF